MLVAGPWTARQVIFGRKFHLSTPEVFPALPADPGKLVSGMCLSLGQPGSDTTHGPHPAPFRMLLPVTN